MAVPREEIVEPMVIAPAFAPGGGRPWFGAALRATFWLGLAVVASLTFVRSGHLGVAIGSIAVAVVGAALDLRRRTPSETILLVGNGPTATLLAASFATPRGSAVHWRGGRPAVTVRRAATLDEATALLGQVRCDEVILAAPASPRPVLLRDVRGRPVTVLAAGEAMERLLGRVPLDFAPADSCLDRLEREASVRPGHAAAKRAVDVLAVGIFGLLALPLVSFLVVLIRIGSPGPGLMGQPRIGRHGRTFRLYRLRTDRQGPRTAPEPATFLERVLLGTRLDLLPALWNVLRGDLTLVGPRPETPALVAARADELPWYAARHAVIPGLTGWAQVCCRFGGTAKGVRTALEYDLYYVKHASFALDLAILLATARMALQDSTRRVLAITRSGATAPTERADRLASVPSRQDQEGTARPRPFPPSLQPALMVGAGDGGKLLAKEMLRNPGWGYLPVAFVDDDPGKIGRRIHGIPVRGDTHDIPALVRHEQIQVVVVAIPSAPEIELARIGEIARRSSARVLAMPHIGALLRGEATSVTLQTVHPTDILGRPLVAPDVARCRSFVAGRRVLITGAAGSIGQELTYQVARLAPAQLVALDVNETGLFDLQQEVARQGQGVDFRLVVASVTNRRRLAAVFARYRPEIVFHAAAYKHVPLMEEHPEEAVTVNAVGTYEVAKAAAAAGVERFVLVSTDKAVRPASVMGATKRVAELAVKAVARDTDLSACCVRFGNVIGSRGSVVPTFEKQITAGGPVTVTDPKMTRYFMTIPEAASLIIQAGAFGDRDAVYMLDMGEEVPIRQLAERMIRLRGLRVGTDVQIVYTGLRPGEKLHEELALPTETSQSTPHPKIRILAEGTRGDAKIGRMPRLMAQLADLGREGTAEELRAALFAAVEVNEESRRQNGGTVLPLAAEQRIPQRSAGGWHAAAR